MSTLHSMYRVHYVMRGSAVVHESANGPFDYRGNAMAERNRVFSENLDVEECWMQNKQLRSGRRLRRRWRP